MKTLSFLRRIILLAALAPVLCGYCKAQAAKIFFADLISGPATGGEWGEGVFVTIYGSGFGATRGASTVTIGGQPAHSYPVWTNSHVSFQIGRNAKSGLIVLHPAGQADSNGTPFTVRPGHIYFIATTGNDRSPGTFARPLRTLVAAKDRLQPGDVAYPMNGIQQATLDKYNSAFSIQTSGKPGFPLAIVAYPGAHVSIGTFASPSIAVRTPNIDRTSNHWVLAGLTFQGAQEALDITASTDWRIIGNDFSCPNGFGPTGCIETAQATYLYLLGNTIHNIAKPRTTKVYHAVYFSTDSNHIDIGWNLISDVRGCRGIQFHSTPIDPGTGLNQYDLHIHDNVIHDVVCDAINLATVDPSKGTIEIYNNLIYNAGTGPDPEDGSSNYACIYIQTAANAGPRGSGTISIHHNTLYNCGARGNTDSGAFAFYPASSQLHVRLWDNIVAVNRGVRLLSPNSASVTLLGESNVFWNEQRDPFGVAQPAFGYFDPLITNPANNDFSLRPSSPATGMGASPNLLR